MKTKRKIKVGFDFDGVIYYNFIRVIRPFIYLTKKYLLHKQTTSFYVPKNGLHQKLFRWYMNYTTLWPNTGFDDFLALCKNSDYEVCIITGRLNFLDRRLEQMVKKYHLDKQIQIYRNEKNEQPHLFKQRLLQKLNLDFYVEDNYDVVSFLNKTTKVNIIWIYNFIDRLFIKYRPQAPNLKEAIKTIKNLEFKKLNFQ